MVRWAARASRLLGRLRDTTPGTRSAQQEPTVKLLPQARYLVVVGAVPLNFGGRTASILTKCRLLKELGGVDSTIVTLNYTADVVDISAELRRRGQLPDGVGIVNLHDYFEADARPTTEVVRHEVGEPGMTTVQEPGRPVYRLYRDGVCRLTKRFDEEGRLLVRDWFDEDGKLTQRDELGANGLVRRTIHRDVEHDQTRQEDFFRSDGTRCMTKRFVLAPGAPKATVGEVTLVDPDGRPTRVLESNVALKQLYLDSLVGDGHAFLSVESRRSDQETLSYRRPSVKQISVLHNPHLAPPGDDPSAVRADYLPLFDPANAVDAVVFLTGAQRADAEAHFGPRPDFRVIPHPVSRAAPARFEDRDPSLVVMLARLHPQKRLGDALTAFAEVVAALPDARLEIYGQGPEQVRLQRQIDRLGLGTSVRLMGYTTDPAAVYRHAALSMLTSSFEGFGLVLLESLSHGCPVISYDVRYGPSDLVTDGVNGYLVAPGSTSALAARVVEVLRDDPLRRRLSDQAVRVADDFSERVFVARWSALFRDLDAEGWG